MSNIVTLDAIANQSFFVNLEGFRFEIAVKSSNTSMFVSVSRDDVTLIDNVRAVGGTPILPYEYLEGDAGNFMFDTPNEVIPYYTNFGVTQFLVYLTASEVGALRDGT